MIASSSFHGRDIYLLKWRRLSIRSTRSFTSPAEYASFGKQQTALFDDGKKSDNTSFPLRSCRNAALASESCRNAADQILKGARLQRRPRASPDHRGLKCSAAAKAPSTKTTAAQLECQSGMQSPRGSRSCYGPSAPFRALWTLEKYGWIFLMEEIWNSVASRTAFLNHCAEWTSTILTCEVTAPRFHKS